MRKARQRTTMTETTFPILFFFGLAGFWFFVAWRTAQTRMKTIPSDRTVSSQAILLGVQTIVFTLLIRRFLKLIGYESVTRLACHCYLVCLH